MKNMKTAGISENKRICDIVKKKGVEEPSNSSCEDESYE